VSIEWFRVVSPETLRETLIVCHNCLRQHKLSLLNRVFGASQTCAKCGISDVKK
jgi:hypothetical protein